MVGYSAICYIQNSHNPMSPNGCFSNFNRCSIV